MVHARESADALHAAPAVECRGLVTLLGRFPALSGLDLSVDAGEAVLLLGPNGAGKSTLLRACAGLVPVSGGSLTVLGERLPGARRQLRRRVGMLGHAGFLYDDLTVEGNVRFAVRAAGASERTVPAALERVGLTGRVAALPVSACSAGQRRRTSLAALVARRPQLWLLDEPHAALDVDGRDLLDAVVREAVAGGATVLLASHDAERAAAVCTRAVTIVGGHVVHDTATATAAPTSATPAASLRAPQREVGDVA